MSFCSPVVAGSAPSPPVIELVEEQRPGYMAMTTFDVGCGRSGSEITACRVTLARRELLPAC